MDFIPHFYFGGVRIEGLDRMSILFIGSAPKMII
jgi:hypothetical protein